MPSINWKQFVLRMPINVSATEIFDAWSTQENLESFFLRSAIFSDENGKQRERNEKIRTGDSFVWRWYGYDDQTKDEHTILDTNGKDYLKFGFADRCIVTISVKQEAGENICEIVQDMTMPEVERQQFFHIDCGRGWTFFLANLKSILEGGVDLRNRNNDLKMW